MTGDVKTISSSHTSKQIVKSIRFTVEISHTSCLQFDVKRLHMDFLSKKKLRHKRPMVPSSNSPERLPKRQ